MHYPSTLNCKLFFGKLCLYKSNFIHFLGEAIFDLTNTIIDEWGIPRNKLQFIITDNGSNMVEAYKLGEVAAMDMDVDVEKETGFDEIEEEEVPGPIPRGGAR